MNSALKLGGVVQATGRREVIQCDLYTGRAAWRNVRMLLSSTERASKLVMGYQKPRFKKIKQNNKTPAIGDATWLEDFVTVTSIKPHCHSKASSRGSLQNPSECSSSPPFRAPSSLTRSCTPKVSGVLLDIQLVTRELKLTTS